MTATECLRPSCDPGPPHPVGQCDAQIAARASAAPAPIVIEQDCELDDEGQVGAWLNVFWAVGHGHDPEAFLRAVVDRCLEYHGAIPAIHADDTPAEVWQENIDRRDGVEFRRTGDAPGPRQARVFPVTVLDLERSRRGAMKCGVDQCREPWDTGAAVKVCVEPGDGVDYTAVRMWLCRDHRGLLPEPSYRVCLVPVGATILLPEKAAS